MSEQCIAVKAVIENEQKQVLLLRQSFDPEVDGAGDYHPPGGIVEPGETLQQALRREVIEETSLEVNVGEVIAVEEWQVAIRGVECYFVGIFYACGISDGTLDIAANEECSGYAWVDLSNIRDFPILQPSRNVIEKFLTANQD